MKLPFVSAWLLLTTSLAMAQPGDAATQLAGIWQVSNEFAAGWQENYQIFANGKVVHNTNQMDPYTRLRSESGTWSLKGNKLILTYKSEHMLVGGKRIKEKDLDDGGDYGYKGYKEVDRAIKPPRVRVVTLGVLNMKAKPPMTTINGKKFWKMKEDPKEYY